MSCTEIFIVVSVDVSCLCQCQKISFQIFHRHVFFQVKLLSLYTPNLMTCYIWSSINISNIGGGEVFEKLGDLLISKS